MQVHFRNSNHKSQSGFKIFYHMQKLQHSWGDLVLVKMRPVHQNYYVLKVYSHKLWLILFFFLVCSILFVVLISLFKFYIEIVVWYFEGLLWTSLSVNACVVLGDFCYFKCSSTMLMRFMTSLGDPFYTEVTNFRITSTQYFRGLVSSMMNIDIVAFDVVNIFRIIWLPSLPEWLYGHW